jgi:hypothetical protein
VKKEPVVKHQPAENHSAAAAVDPLAQGSAEDLRRYGIAAVQVTTYEWSGYRYSSAADAIAAAKRAVK